MLSDRSYMRAPSGRTPPSVLTWFLGILVAVFIVQSVSVAQIWLDYGALSAGGIRHGKVWTLFTYALLHGGLAHLLINGLGLFFFGRELEAALGSRRFVQALFATALGGALVWLALHFRRSDSVIGASGILMGLLTIYACLYPRRPLTMLLFFVIPVTLQPMWIVALFGGIDLLGLVFWELPGHGSLYGVAHSAHLGGLAAGWLFYQLFVARSQPFMSGAASAIEPPAWFRRRAPRPPAAYTVNLSPPPAAARPSPPVPTSRDSLRAEVDRILDKINLHGFGALTPEEKRVLDEARQHLNPR